MATQFIAFYADTCAQNAILATVETSEMAIAKALSDIGGDITAEDLVAQPVTDRLAALLDSGANVKSWVYTNGKADVLKTEIDDKDVEDALKVAGGFHMYVLENDDTGEISVEYSSLRLNSKWSDEWIEINEVADFVFAARSKNPKAEMKALLKRTA
jgi:hypothetical protein